MVAGRWYFGASEHTISPRATSNQQLPHQLLATSLPATGKDSLIRALPLAVQAVLMLAGCETNQAELGVLSVNPNCEREYTVEAGEHELVITRTFDQQISDGYDSDGDGAAGTFGTGQ